MFRWASGTRKRPFFDGIQRKDAALSTRNNDWQLIQKLIYHKLLFLLLIT